MKRIDKMLRDDYETLYLALLLGTGVSKEGHMMACSRMNCSNCIANVFGKECEHIIDEWFQEEV